MATINIEFTKEEKDKVVKALKKLGSTEVLSVSTIANKAGMNPNRVRFILLDVEKEGRIIKHVARQFNARWIRYRYEVVE